MNNYDKRAFPVADVRRFLEPGPIVLVSSHHRGQSNIMTMGWHMILGFEPSLVGCYVWTENHSFDLIRKSRECVINIPTADMARTVVDIGNCSGREVDKFAKFKLTPRFGKRFGAPSIEECFANFECRLVDARLISKYSLFVLEVIRARVATAPRYPRTIHYRGDGVFMISGTNTVRFRSRFRPEML